MGGSGPQDVSNSQMRAKVDVLAFTRSFHPPVISVSNVISYRTMRLKLKSNIAEASCQFISFQNLKLVAVNLDN